MRKSKIIKIVAIEYRNAADCVLSGEYDVYYSSGLHRKYPFQCLTTEMHKFMIKNNAKRIRTGKTISDSRNNYETTEVYNEN